MMDEFTFSEREVAKHFRVVRLLGKGSFAKAYLVERYQDGKLYALKQTDIKSLPSHVRQDVVNEVRLLASIRHPNIVKYFEAFMDGSFLCVVMEALTNGDMSHMIQAHKEAGSCFPEDTIWAYLLQVGQGLRHLHSRHIMHRDVKPQNVLVSGEGVVKVVDLGIAKMMRDPLTRTMIGTPNYMAPEVLGRQAYSFGCDVWSMGCLCYEMAALRPPYEGKDIKKLHINVLMGWLERIPACYSDDLWLLIRSMLASQPHLRPDMEEITGHYSVLQRAHLVPPEAAMGLGEDPPQPSILDTIHVPEELELLNKHLPPAAYETGCSVLDHILMDQQAAMIHRSGQPSAGLWGSDSPKHVLKQGPPLRASSFQITAVAGAAASPRATEPSPVLPAPVRAQQARPLPLAAAPHMGLSLLAAAAGMGAEQDSGNGSAEPAPSAAQSSLQAQWRANAAPVKLHPKYAALLLREGLGLGALHAQPLDSSTPAPPNSPLQGMAGPLDPSQPLPARPQHSSRQCGCVAPSPSATSGAAGTGDSSPICSQGPASFRGWLAAGPSLGADPSPFIPSPESQKPQEPQAAQRTRPRCLAGLFRQRRAASASGSAPPHSECSMASTAEMQPCASEPSMRVGPQPAMAMAALKAEHSAPESPVCGAVKVMPSMRAPAAAQPAGDVQEGRPGVTRWVVQTFGKNKSSIYVKFFIQFIRCIFTE